MKRGLLSIVFCLVLWLPCLHAQESPLTPVAAAPCKEIYDMLEDRRGFIWIGDNLGLRRFDGVSFTSFTQSAQSSVSISGLCEDRHGRIWCHNFSGQIFYIEHEKMHLLEAYDFKVERAFPHIALCGDELVATSLRGMFVCNTNTLQCRYLPLGSGTTSLSMVGDKTVLFGDGKWYVYKTGRAVQVPVSGGRFANPDLRSLVLCTASDGKHVFASTDLRTQLHIFSFTGQQIVLTDIRQYNSFINTVSVKNREIWVHTQTKSYSLTDTAATGGCNLSCILKDRSGNRWYSSLEKGLLVAYARQNREIVKNSPVPDGDFIRCLRQGTTYLTEGSQRGKLYITDSTGKPVQQYELPTGAGSVEKIQLFGADDFYIECSVGLYFVQPATHTFRCINRVLLCRDLWITDSLLYVCTSHGLLRPDIKLLAETDYNVGTELLNKRQRCRAVRYDSLSKSLFIAYADGLYRLQSNRLYPVLYQNNPLYISSMEYHNGKIYAGSFSGDFFVIENNSVRTYRPDNTSGQTAILRMKLCGDRLWLLKTSGVSVFNPIHETFEHNNRELAYLNGGDIYDLEETGGAVYFTTAAAMYKIQLQDKAPLQPPPLFLLYTMVNNRDTVFGRRTRFSPNAGSLSFYLATPWLHNNSDVRIRYALRNANRAAYDSTVWYYLEPSNRVIAFNSLKPGVYSLRVEAGINGDFAYATSHIDYPFIIRKRWYNHGWFYLVISAVALGLVLLFYRYRIRQLTKIEKLRWQISGDLHDEIGSTISSINIYSQLIKNGSDPFKYIDIIQENTVQVISNLDDVVWNINPKNDTLAQLISRMKLFALPYLSDNGIEVSFDTDIDKDSRILSPEVRTDCYLVFKEAINNIVKHAQCTTCHIYFYQKKKELRLQVKDNGKGFDVNEATLHRNGLTTMRMRIRKLRGKLNIHSVPGTGTEINLSCRLPLL